MLLAFVPMQEWLNANYQPLLNSKRVPLSLTRHIRSLAPQLYNGADEAQPLFLEPSKKDPQRYVAGGAEECSLYKSIKDPELSLFEAASYDNVTAARCLIQAGANVSAVVTGGFTPIHASASRGNLEISRMLVEGGARVNVHDSIVGLSPLHSAAGNNHLEIAVLLLSAGANVNDKSKMNQMPLQVAATGGFTDMSRLLLDKGAAVNVKDRMGHTPLHIAATRGYKSLVELLVQRGADLSAKTIFGKTAYDMASKYPDIRSLLGSDTPS
ncbi:hypothetical protein C0J52_26388 [Blattella germanica]|nr:hypothetical protein C0J52_26388 [Blattella germanica]